MKSALKFVPECIASELKKPIFTGLIVIFFSIKKNTLYVLSENDVTHFLGHLDTARGCSIKTQKVALNTLVFIYRHVIKQPLKDMPFQKASKPQSLPTVLSHHEAKELLATIAPHICSFLRFSMAAGFESPSAYA